MMTLHHAPSPALPQTRTRVGLDRLARRLKSLGALAFIALLVAAPLPARGDDNAPKNDVTKAEHFMQKLEQEVRRYGGKPFTPRYDGQEALRRIKDLKTRFPKDPAVEALFQRARAALMASKGDTFEITPAMLAYRQNEQQLTKTLSKLGDEEWALRKKEWKQSGALVAKPFVAPDPMKTAADTMIGNVVVLDDFVYPRNEFTDTGGQYVFVGSGTKGYYFVELSGRAWKGAYGAIQRYRRQVNSELPEVWQLAGTITGVTLLVPQAGEEKTLSPAWGWVVSPLAIMVAGRTVAWADPQLEEGGVFAGEVRLPELKGKTYTFTEVPKDVEPLKLLEIFATAIKEKNWELFLDCIEPARKKTPTAIGRLRYFYENNLERYRKLYVYIHPVSLDSIKVIKGVDEAAGTAEDFFLDDKQRADVKRHAEDKVEEATITIRPYDERGRQVLLPKPVKMRRYAGGRWYISEGYPL